MNKHETIDSQMKQRLYLTDGGLETTLIFHQGRDLPHFAAFPLLESEEGREVLRDYYLRYAQIAEEAGRGFIFEAPTWRAHPVWGEVMAYGTDGLDRINRNAVDFMHQLREECDTSLGHLVSGCVGPRGDGYVADHTMAVEQALDYHRPQVESFAAAGADLVSAMTLNYAEVAMGVVLATREAGIPVVISFTTETDGRLPDGMELGQAIDAVDDATGGGPLYYMINCAHPDHFDSALRDQAPWLQRLGGIRANASRMSHEELDNSEVLDDGDPEELGAQLQALQQRLPQIRVLGGCCGTDHRHVGHMCGVPD